MFSVGASAQLGPGKSFCMFVNGHSRSLWMKVLSKLRYVVLVYLVVRVLVTGTALLQDYSPSKPLFSWGGTPLTIGITALFTLLSVFIYRPFCRRLCPLGVLLSLVSRFSLFRIHMHDDCIKCMAVRENARMGQSAMAWLIPGNACCAGSA